jgi:hypothetical protein
MRGMFREIAKYAISHRWNAHILRVKKMHQMITKYLFAKPNLFGYLRLEDIENKGLESWGLIQLSFRD